METSLHRRPSDPLPNSVSASRPGRRAIDRSSHPADLHEPMGPDARPRLDHAADSLNRQSADEDMRKRQLAGIQALLALSVPISESTVFATSSFVAIKQIRLFALLKDPALRGAIALMLSTAVGGGLAFAFWAVTTHHHSAGAVGSISAEVSSITFLSSVGSLNLITIFARFLPVAGGRARRLIIASYCSAGLAGLLAATIFLVSPLSNGLVIGGTSGRLGFAVCVILYSVFNIQDGGLIGFGQFSWIPVENISVAVMRLALLPLAAIFLSGRTSVLWSWALPTIIAVVVVNIFILGPLASRKRKQPTRLPSYGKLRRLVAVGSASNSVTAAVSAFLPALVTHQLGPSQGGYFYVPWLVTTMVLLLINNITTSMTREVVANPSRAALAIRRSVALAATAGTLAMVGCLFLAPYALAPLGSSFSTHGALLLHWIGLAMPGTTVIVLFWAVCTIRQRPWPAFAVNLTTSIAIVAGVLLLKSGVDISRVGMIYCIVQWSAAAVLSLPTFTGLRSIARHPDDL